MRLFWVREDVIPHIGLFPEIVPFKVFLSHIKPRPQNRILVSLRGSFLNFCISVLFIWVPNPPPPGSHSRDAEFAHVDNRINLTRFFFLVERLFSEVLCAMPKNNSKEGLSWEKTPLRGLALLVSPS